MTPEPSIGIDGAFVVRTHEQQSYRDLWASVLTIAAQDLARKSRRNYTLDWLNSGVEDEVGSFVWICDVLDYDPERTRKNMLAGKGKPKVRGMRGGRAAARN